MKKFVLKSLTIIIVQLLISCGSDDDQTSVLTTLKGRVYDVERKVDVKDFKLVLGTIDCRFSNSLNGCFTDPVDSVWTDEKGNYSITYNHVLGKKYNLLKQYYGTSYYTEIIQKDSIIPGKENIKDVDAWYPVILALNLKIRNNNNEPLTVGNGIVDNDNISYSFGTQNIFEQEKDTLIYLRTKPNSDIEVRFTYSTGNFNEDFHHYREIAQTNLADTLRLSYTIDCSTF
ncbi:hypothetical protein J8L88_18620 [Aquimarina sp. MMG015]|uniref:hypothetical protein n=1 Tax=unclassified Aquimarina TaxID=2627091 RepID=UPI000E5444AF|nr:MULTISPECIES: hypothetical protein [unclassified Aquimarina]AXT58285.1 hypothetical protein D1815_21885 [Aquimarina sp. AD1]MBQ4804885.1 hypothetical protein [Aquimarina sp. MMG015]RKN25502.1 hypothetical protein D7035_10110 [Aquimarina sp. AD1]